MSWVLIKLTKHVGDHCQYFYEQASLYAIKKVILSNRQQNYLDSLKGILVENALNM